MPHVDEDLDQVVRLELMLLDPAVRNDPEQLLTFLHPQFREYGASGRTWDRQSIPQAAGGTNDPIAATDVAARRLGPDAVLVTYRSDAAGRRALRSSTWVREAGRWLVLFHQGTLVEVDQNL